MCKVALHLEKDAALMEEEEWDDDLLSKLADIEAQHLCTASARSVPAGPAPPPPSVPHPAVPSVGQASTFGQWSCRSCTLMNAPALSACSVCGTPKGQLYDQTRPASLSGNAAATMPSVMQAKKTVQSTISFGAPPPVGRVFHQHISGQQLGERGPESVQRPRSGTRGSQSLLTAAPSQTSARSMLQPSTRNSHGQTTMHQPSVAPFPLVATGEDSMAKQRYLDVVNRSSYPQIDYEAADRFVYPTNYPVRDYQLAITEKALYHNTLASLPTGLGKTLIASVVMYNFYRWFPRGKIVFMAPTKPLVAQQIKACHEIMGIPQADTAELQGSVSPSIRKVLWKSKRVFFCTPQSMQNDLRNGVCHAEDFVCLVVDEAHRATGNYAYCGVIQAVEQKTPFFRVLALSATPGSKFDVIQDVVKNLRISHIESRSADDYDVKKYTHARQEEVIVCKLSNQITEVKALLMKVFLRIVQRLFQGDVIQYHDPERLTRWYVLQAREKFRQSPSYDSNRGAESDLAMLISLLHAKNLLTVHGLSSFKEYVLGWVEERQSGGRLSWSKKEMLQSSEFHALELSLATVSAGNGTQSNASTGSASHPKLTKLREVLHEHFQRHAAGGSSTRAIVFTQYRTSVVEIVELLKPLAPLLKVQQFVGQGTSGKLKENKGQSQKVQQEIVEKFRQGIFNVLIATCIAEEGLDIGEVDLIVSFDALTSPVRMIQRMGRTGRKRVGKVIILVTEGDEEKKLARSAAAAKTVNRALTTFKNKFSYSKCPRMIPNGIKPRLSQLEMNIPKFQASKVAGKQISDGQGRRRYEQTGWVLDDSWKLNDIERSITTAKFAVAEFESSERNLLHPIVAQRRQLLRRRTVSEARAASLVGYSARSMVLVSMVRKINGVDEDEWECAMHSRGGRGDPQACDEDVVETAEDVSRNWSSSRENSSLATHTLKSPQDVIELDDSLQDIDTHYSPQYIDPVPDNGTPDEKEAVNGGSELHSKQTRKSTTITSSTKAIQDSSTLARGRAAKVTDRKVASANKKILVDPQDVERGEQLLEQLLELQSLSLSLSPTPSTSDDRAFAESSDDKGDNLAADPPVFPRLSISRQLRFDGDDPARMFDYRGSNCVPAPPEPCQPSAQCPVDENPVEDMVVQIVTHPSPTPPIPRRSLSLRKMESKTMEAKKPVDDEFDGSTNADPVVRDAVKARHEGSTPSDDEACSICREDESLEDDPIVFCDGCNVPVHQFCYGIDRIPEGEWYCDACRLNPVSCSSEIEQPSRGKQLDCYLCPLRGGAMKRTECGRWVHVQCFLWIPELQLTKNGEGLSLGSLHALDSDRYDLDCSVCHSRKGKGIIQCAYKQCLVAFHVSCAAFAHHKLVQLDPPKASSDAGTLFLAYCPLHSNIKDPETALHHFSNQRPPPSTARPVTISLVADESTPTRNLHSTSPSSLLLSMAEDDSGKKFRRFRRLKRKYGASQSPGEGSASRLSEGSSPWGKQVKRSKKHAERSKLHALASLYIESEVEVRGGKEDEYGESGCSDPDEEDDSFINDTSQLLYSQSATPTSARSRKRRRSGPISSDMRAIYARSLLESPDTPEFLRRGRDMRAIPAGGVISACLDQLEEESKNLPTSSRLNGARRSLQMNAAAPQNPGVIEPSVVPGDRRSGSEHRANDHEDATIETEMAFTESDCSRIPAVAIGGIDESGFAESEHAPSFNLLSGLEPVDHSTPLSTVAADNQVASVANIGLLVGTTTNPPPPSETASADSNGADLVRERIEANRLKALAKLQQRRQAKAKLDSFAARDNLPQCAQHQNDYHREDHVEASIVATAGTVQVNCDPVVEAPSFQLLPVPHEQPEPEIQQVVHGSSTPASTVIFVNKQFAGSQAFSLLMELKDTKLSAEIDDSLEADILLSSRTAVLWLAASEVSDFLEGAPSRDAQKHPRVRTLVSLFKKVLVVLYVDQVDSSDAAVIDRLGLLQNTRLIVLADIRTLCGAVLRVVAEELKAGFRLYRSKLDSSPLALSAEGNDEMFGSRLAFFRAIPGLSIGSALSLSFRFANFSVGQIPVRKFNEMHWRRMLPWITETTAKQVHEFIGSQLG